MNCPKCGQPMGSRPGQAVASMRRRKTNQINEYGQRLDAVAVVKCTIVECLNVDTTCETAMAGFMVNGRFMHDENLIPLSKVFNALMQDRYEREQES